MTFNRRNFIGLSLAGASAPVLAQSSLLQLLTAPNAVQTVHAIVKQYLQVGDEHLDLVARFTASLQVSLKHTESPETFRELLNQSSDQDSLANYVIQEFVIATNYLAFAAKEEGALELLS